MLFVIASVLACGGESSPTGPPPAVEPEPAEQPAPTESTEELAPATTLDVCCPERFAFGEYDGTDLIGTRRDEITTMAGYTFCSYNTNAEGTGAMMVCKGDRGLGVHVGLVPKGMAGGRIILAESAADDDNQYVSLDPDTLAGTTAPAYTLEERFGGRYGTLISLEGSHACIKTANLSDGEDTFSWVPIPGGTAAPEPTTPCAEPE